mgnify:FL=1
MFSTANGRIEARNVVPLYCSELNQLVHPYLLHDTPPVLSVGKRCMEQGFTFHWEAGQLPIMTNPEGLVVELEVERNIPYLRSGSEYALPRPARETKLVAISPMVEASSSHLDGIEAPLQQDDEVKEASESGSVENCLPGEEMEENEDEYADSEELDAMEDDAATPDNNSHHEDDGPEQEG